MAEEAKPPGFEGRRYLRKQELRNFSLFSYVSRQDQRKLTGTEGRQTVCWIVSNDSEKYYKLWKTEDVSEDFILSPRMLHFGEETETSVPILLIYSLKPRLFCWRPLLRGSLCPLTLSLPWRVVCKPQGMQRFELWFVSPGHGGEGGVITGSLGPRVETLCSNFCEKRLHCPGRRANPGNTLDMKGRARWSLADWWEPG